MIDLIQNLTVHKTQNFQFRYQNLQFEHMKKQKKKQ